MDSSSINTAGLSLIDIACAVLRYRRMILVVALATSAIMGTYALTRPRVYTSHAAFTPQATRSSIGALGGIAAQFGVAVAGADGNQSPAFYADLLRSRTILESLVQVPVSAKAGGSGAVGSYMDAVTRSDHPHAERIADAVAQLRSAMTVEPDPRTGIVEIRTTTYDPQVSAVLSDSALALLNRFNVNSRRSQAAALSTFLGNRESVTLKELRQAEDDLASFARRNRVASSPDLAAERERLSRMVLFRQQVHESVAQALEQAKLDEIRDTPLITVIEAAETPVVADPRGVASKTGAALFVGLFLGVIIAAVRYSVAKAAASNPELLSRVRSEAGLEAPQG